MKVYVNRSLNLKKIKYIGFDLDYTLVRYNTEAFERLAQEQTIRILIEDFDYPQEIREMHFDSQRAIVGLVIDGKNGNLLKLNLFGKVKAAYHGLEEIHYRDVRDLYKNVAIDVQDPDYIPLDTNFAISSGVLYGQLVEKKKQGMKLPDYRDIAQHIITALDRAHINGSIKNTVIREPENYVIIDPNIPQLLERYIDYGKKLIIITNSDFAYAESILNYALSPYLKKAESWFDLFEYVITLADKPLFFSARHRFLNINRKDGSIRNHIGDLEPGIYQGGYFTKLEADLGIQGDEILYLGDHIYGDIVAIKKLCGWRTGLVVCNLEEEIRGVRRGEELQKAITDLSARKTALEEEVNTLYLDRYEGKGFERERIKSLVEAIDELNITISNKLVEHKKNFNPYWGELMRAGREESRYAGQVYEYACIYMTQVADFLSQSPYTYFQPNRRLLPHESS